MAHKTLIGGTAYEITGGKTLIGGTGYGIAGGRTLVGGTGYDVSFVPSPEASTLNGCSWKNISDLAAAGLAASYFAVGDCKAVTINGTIGVTAFNVTLYAYIIGFNHNGATNTIDFGNFKTAASGGVDVCLCDSRFNQAVKDGTKCFNLNHWPGTNGNESYGGWKGCDCRYDILGSTNVAPSGYGSALKSSRVGYDATSTCATNPVSGTLMAALPSELRAVMKPMTIYTDNVGNNGTSGANVTASVDYLPLLAEFEIFGSRTYANSSEKNKQARYQYYKNGNSSEKYKHNATTTTANWWGRSPASGSNNGVDRFCMVRSYQGQTYTNQTRDCYGLAPIFRV